MPILRIHREKSAINKKRKSFNFLSFAVRRGLEPLTPCVTGTYSNQLN